ncbi:MAG TPA: DNA-directed RNA polymerase subunit alpha [Anaerolineales bacterium]|nr:DNA-directed RNA polymerase subunit alpha [Anaerolineales bacterium]
MPQVIERETVAEARNYGKFNVFPLDRGYGVTLGNALRRVLLSSLEGAAVTSIRLTDVLHEFSDIPGVKEDVIQVILNVKQLRMKLIGVESTRMSLSIKGEGVVTAADINVSSDVEIINPDLYLFTVDDPNTRVDIEFTVEKGVGYSPANDRSGHLPIGEMPVDAIFSPVKRVNWDVNSYRVKQSTDFDKLTIEIWTDGTITPEKALSSAAMTLIEHLRYLAGLSETVAPIVKEVESLPARTQSGLTDVSIDQLDLSVRVFNSLKRTGIQNVADVLDLLEKGDQAVMSIRNFGDKSLDELRQKMIEKGYLKVDQSNNLE